jgi:chromosome segregation ATPase
MSEKPDTVDSEEPINGLEVDWGADFSLFSKELEEARAHLQEAEAEAASQSHEVKAAHRRVEAQDALIESLKVDADETATLKQEIHDKDLTLENRNSEIRSKHELINALRQEAEGIGRLKGGGKTKDQEIARLTKEKQQAEQQAAKLTEEFEIFTAATLTGIDAAAELKAVRAELDARKSLIERQVRIIAVLHQAVASWKEKCASLKLHNSSSEPAIIPALSDPGEEEPQAPESAKDVSGDPTAATVLEAYQTTRTKIATSR